MPIPHSPLIINECKTMVVRKVNQKNKNCMFNQILHLYVNWETMTTSSDHIIELQLHKIKQMKKSSCIDIYAIDGRIII